MHKPRPSSSRKNNCQTANPFSALLAMPLALGLAMGPVPALAQEDGLSTQAVYLPGVTAEMSEGSYWANLRTSADALLASSSDVTTRNANAFLAKGNNLINLRIQPDTFNGNFLC